MKKFQSLLALALFAMGAWLAPAAPAQSTVSKRSILTFDQSFEVPGKVLPAGTYVFRIMDSQTNKHIVQIYSADESHLIWTCLAINNNRVQPTNKTVMTFGEASGDSPQPLKAWFFPGDSWGQEFVYPKRRAVEIAATVLAPVPAMPDNVVLEQIPAEQIAALPVADVLPPSAPAPVAAPAPAPAPAPVVEAALAAPATLPQTASPMPWIGLLGLFCLGLALAVRRPVFARASSRS